MSDLTGGPWTSHGHPVDGVTVHSDTRPPVARCGGPGLCGECSSEAVSLRQNQRPPKTEPEPQSRTLSDVLWDLPEHSATSSRDFGRGYAMAIVDVVHVLNQHDRSYLTEPCSCIPPQHTKATLNADGALWGLYWALFATPWPWWKDAPDGIIDAYARVQNLIRT